MADHHQHLVSPASAGLLNDPPRPALRLPEGVVRLMRQRAERWDDADALADLFTTDSIVLRDFDPAWIRGRAEVAAFLATRFAKPFRLTPIAFTARGSGGHLAGYYSRGESSETQHIGHFYMALERGRDSAWRIAVEKGTFPGPRRQEPITAEDLMGMLDTAGIGRAAVLSTAYWFDSPQYAVFDPYPKVRAENDWTVQQTARFPGRFVAFCSFNPLKDHALPELERCRRLPGVKGIKLHFGMSGVDLKDPEHVRRVRGVFVMADRHRLAIVVHVRADATYGRQHAEVFLNELVAAAPRVPVQIAHLWGGEAFSADALAAYADAASAGRLAARNLYFDVADVALVAGASDGMLNTLAAHMRQIGLDRILYGSDAAMEGHPAPREAWAVFRSRVPLTDHEFRTIAENLAPYLR